MNSLLVFLAMIGLVMVCPPTWAELVVEVTKGQDDAIPIAIVPFNSPTEAAASFDVAQLVSDDLARSGRFKSMARKDMIETPHTGASISFDDWRRLNNDYIVVGQLQAENADRYNIVFELYNVLTRQRLLGYQISANKAGLRLASHQVADMVFPKILGVRGAFATRVAYGSVLGHVPNKSYQLVVADADRMNPRVVMQSNETLIAPSWSPDGRSLYFTSDRAGGPQIYRVGIQPGDKPRRLTFQNAYNARPRLSPDESQLAFVTQEEGAYRIATMDLRGRGDVQVLTRGHFDVSPSYAPNGAEIIYASRDRGRGVLALVSADGRVQERLVSSEGEVQEPAWSPF